MQNSLSDFSTNGFFVHEFSNIDALSEIKQICELQCKQNFQDKFVSLEKYHLLEQSDEEHFKFQYKLFSILNEKRLHETFALANIDFFKELFGHDIDIQTGLYLRIARPNEKLDNIGLHRDTDYGNSAYEISFSLPLVDQKDQTALKVVPGSHNTFAESGSQSQRFDVEKGSYKNQMGFLYSPKRPSDLDEKEGRAIPIPLKFGQALGFTIALIHGQQENTSDISRWSIDFRLKNSFHPLNHNLKKGYYSPLVSGVISSTASMFYSCNQAQVAELIGKTE